MRTKRSFVGKARDYIAAGANSGALIHLAPKSLDSTALCAIKGWTSPRNQDRAMETPKHTALPSSHTAARVDAHVFISGWRRACDREFLRKNRITKIVRLAPPEVSGSAGDSVPEEWISGVSYLVVPAEDHPDFDLRRFFVPCVRFIRAAIAAGERVLVHCHAGVSRSATIVLLYLMLDRGHTLVEALLHLRRVRPQVQPNRGFLRHLAATDDRIRAIRAVRTAV